MAQGDLGAALKSYEARQAIISCLATSDPGNAGWQRDLSVSYEKVGGVQEAQGNLAGALKSYSDSLAIRDRLATSDNSRRGDAYASLREAKRAKPAAKVSASPWICRVFKRPLAPDLMRTALKEMCSAFAIK